MQQSKDEFVAANQSRWTELDRLLGVSKALHRRDGATIARVAALYRSLCADLMRARGAGYAQDLLGYLDGLAGLAHSALYGAAPLRFPALLRLVAVEFPRAFRESYRFVALSLALFLIPCLIGLVGALTSPELAVEVLPAVVLEGMVHAYSEGFEAGRASGVDAGMTGFYVYNNVGIAFRCFATGILFGTGSIFFLVYNGLMIGTVTGYVAQAGYGGNILTFMCGHAPFELTAIIIAGAAGLQMGYALVDTGGRTRIGSLRHQAPVIARLIVGAAVMLVIAALVEGFWSPSSVAPSVKWAVAALFTVAAMAFLAFAGRRRTAS
ncbi:MAG: stage II sporulation protein M [Deltaproteobacteria bacterium]|nr:stage II sporulation protein M [Deltaproteobacteria bacterium]